jgi:four helix bundle protein
MEKIRNFKDLRMWQQGIQVVKQVYLVTRSFPAEERFGLVQQMRKAAVSIPSNIAEGFNRRHLAEKLQFLGIAAGSSAELETQIIIAREIGCLDVKTTSELVQQVEILARMITSAAEKIRGPVPFVAESPSYQLLDTSYGENASYGGGNE